MPFPVHTKSGVYVISDSSLVRGKQKAIAAQADLDEEAADSVGISLHSATVPANYKGPICPRCGGYQCRAIRSHPVEAAGFAEPSHRAANPTRPLLPRYYSCGGCGKRWTEAA